MAKTKQCGNKVTTPDGDELVCDLPEHEGRSHQTGDKVWSDPFIGFSYPIVVPTLPDNYEPTTD